MIARAIRSILRFFVCQRKLEGKENLNNHREEETTRRVDGKEEKNSYCNRMNNYLIDDL